MSHNDPFKSPDTNSFDPFSRPAQGNSGDIPSSFTTPSTQGRNNPNGKNSLSSTLRNPLDPPGFGTNEPLDPAYKNPLDSFTSPADSLFSGKSKDSFKTEGKK